MVLCCRLRICFTYILLKGETQQAYNIADASSNISIRELAELIAQLGGEKVITILPEDMEKKSFNVVTKSVFSTKKLEALGWQLKGCMKDKMLATIKEAGTL